MGGAVATKADGVSRERFNEVQARLGVLEGMKVKGPLTPTEAKEKAALEKELREMRAAYKAAKNPTLPVPQAAGDPKKAPKPTKGAKKEKAAQEPPAQEPTAQEPTPVKVKATRPLDAVIGKDRSAVVMIGKVKAALETQFGPGEALIFEGEAYASQSYEALLHTILDWIEF